MLYSLNVQISALSRRSSTAASTSWWASGSRTCAACSRTAARTTRLERPSRSARRSSKCSSTASCSLARCPHSWRLPARIPLTDFLRLNLSSTDLYQCIIWIKSLIPLVSRVLPLIIVVHTYISCFTVQNSKSCITRLFSIACCLMFLLVSNITCLARILHSYTASKILAKSPDNEKFQKKQ